MFRRREGVSTIVDGVVVVAVVGGGGRKLGMQRRARRVIVVGARMGTEVAIGARCTAER